MFSLVCALSLFFLFLFFFFYRYFPWQILTIHSIAGLTNHLPTNIHLVHWDFWNCFCTQINCNCRTEIFILFEFLLMQLIRSYWLWHCKVTLWGFELILNYHPTIIKQTPQPTEIYTLSHNCLSITPIQPYP